MLDVATVCLPIPPTTLDCSLFTRFLLYLRSFAFGHHARPEAFDTWTTDACGARGTPHGAHDAAQRHNAPRLVAPGNGGQSLGGRVRCGDVRLRRGGR